MKLPRISLTIEAPRGPNFERTPSNGAPALNSRTRRAIGTAKQRAAALVETTKRAPEALAQGLRWTARKIDGGK